jgi:hypothetical protein
LPGSGPFVPAALGHAPRQLFGPPSSVALHDELVPTRAKPLHILVRAEAPVEANERPLPLVGGALKDALELVDGPFEDLAGGGVARIELTEGDLPVLRGARPNQLPARGVAFCAEVTLSGELGLL